MLGTLLEALGEPVTRGLGRLLEDDFFGESVGGCFLGVRGGWVKEIHFFFFECIEQTSKKCTFALPIQTPFQSAIFVEGFGG